MKMATVLTLSYNSPDLYGTIDSVLMQTYKKIQLVIVDDNSKEFDKAKVLEYISAHNQGNVIVNVIVNDVHQGIIKSSNIALDHSLGDYIINLAGDDQFYDETVVEDVVSEFERTGVLALTGYRCICNDAMQKTSVIRPSRRQVLMIKHLSPLELFEKMAGYNFIFGCCSAHSRECFERFGCYDEKYYYLDDYSMNMRLLRNGVAIKFFDRIMIKYRNSGISAITNISAIYQKEADLVFENEIKPYSVKQKKAKKRYYAWKRRIKIDQAYMQRCEKYQGNIVKLVIVKFFYYLLSPQILILVLSEKVGHRQEVE